MSELNKIRCATCRMTFGVPDWFYEAVLADGKPFNCPNGHGLSYGEKARAVHAKKREPKRSPFKLVNFSRAPAKPPSDGDDEKSRVTDGGDAA